MAGYIGSKTSVTVISPQTDSRYVNTTGDTMSGSLAVNGSVTASYANLNGNGVPVIINSANGNNYKVSFVHAGTQASYLGADASNALMVGNANAINLMSVDSSGRVIAPSQTAFSAFNLTTGSQYPVSAATWNTFNNNLTNWGSPRWSAETNIGSSFSTTNGRFTAPVAGRYRTTLFVCFWVTNTTYITLFKNGTYSSPYALAYNSGLGGYQCLSISRIMTLAAGDYVEPGGYIPSGTYIPGGGYIQFSGELIG